MAAQPNAQTQDHGAARAEAPRLPKACGYCHNCNITVDDHIVFCEPFCRQQWHHERGAGPAPVR